MEPSQNNQTLPTATQEVVVPVEKTTSNIHTIFRHFVLIVCILFTISIILFLFYQNGKSIYDNGI